MHLRYSQHVVSLIEWCGVVGVVVVCFLWLWYFCSVMDIVCVNVAAAVVVLWWWLVKNI